MSKIPRQAIRFSGNVRLRTVPRDVLVNERRETIGRNSYRRDSLAKTIRERQHRSSASRIGNGPRRFRARVKSDHGGIGEESRQSEANRSNRGRCFEINVLARNARTGTSISRIAPRDTCAYFSSRNGLDTSIDRYGFS